jgi:hypothetical protein
VRDDGKGSPPFNFEGQRLGIHKRDLERAQSWASGVQSNRFQRLITRAQPSLSSPAP